VKRPILMLAICFVGVHLLLGVVLLVIEATYGIHDQDISFAIAMLFHTANYPTVWVLRFFGVNPSIVVTLVAGVVQWGVLGAGVGAVVRSLRRSGSRQYQLAVNPPGINDEE